MEMSKKGGNARNGSNLATNCTRRRRINRKGKKTKLYEQSPPPNDPDLQKRIFNAQKAKYQRERDAKARKDLQKELAVVQEEVNNLTNERNNKLQIIAQLKEHFAHFEKLALESYEQESVVLELQPPGDITQEQSDSVVIVDDMMSDESYVQMESSVTTERIQNSSQHQSQDTLELNQQIPQSNVQYQLIQPAIEVHQQLKVQTDELGNIGLIDSHGNRLVFIPRSLLISDVPILCIQ